MDKSVILGEISVCELHGPWSDFMNKLHEWFDGFKRFLRKEDPWEEKVQKWHEEDGVIYFPVTSDGTTGEAWIKRLEDKGHFLDANVKNLLRSNDFKSTNGVTTNVAVLKGRLFADNNRTTPIVHAFAFDQKFERPNAEIVCLIREKFTDNEIKQMGLQYIVVMHEPITDPYGDSNFLSVMSDSGRYWQSTYCNRRDVLWGRDGGFVFAVPRVSA